MPNAQPEVGHQQQPLQTPPCGSLEKASKKTQPRRRDNRNVLGQLHARAQSKRFQRNHDF
jgi:hypothetical protein